MLRVSLHPRGLAPAVTNFSEWREHVLGRLAARVRLSGDRALAELLPELCEYPAPPTAGGTPPGHPAGPPPSAPQPTSPRSLEGVAAPLEPDTALGHPFWARS